jgi:hypothetical protein
MNGNDEDRMEQLLKRAILPVGSSEPERDLWPAMSRRMEKRPAAPPWFDWVLAGGVAIFVVAFPAAIPVFLYYL